MEFTKKYYAATPGGASGGGTNNPGNNAANSMNAANNAADEFKDTVASLKDAFISLGDAIKRSITDNLVGADRATQDLGKTLAQDLKTAVKSLGKDSQELLSNTLAMETGSLKLETVQRQLSSIAKKRLKAENDIAIALKNGVISEAQALKYALQLEEAYTEQRSMLAAQAVEAARVEKTMGKLGGIFKGLAKIPIVGQLIDAEKVLKRMREAAAQGASKWKTFGVGINETFKSIGETITDPAFIIGGIFTTFVKLVKLAAEYQSKQFEAAKDLGVSVNRGKQLRDNFVALARANTQLGVTADQLQKSYAGVQDELGVIVKQSNEFNLTSTLIERRTGATAAHMATLQFAAKKMGTSLMDAYKNIIGSAKAEGARLKLAMSEKQILEGISKVSATIYQNFKGNYKQIAAAVVESKKLGVTLDQINGVQDQFLDFETSIQKQFEAEVLTGKELDLTKIRQLALTHKTKELMEEIVKITGTASEFNKLDTLTQMSKAEALGMSREQIHQMLMDQEKMNLLGEAAGADLQTQYNMLAAQGKTRAEIAGIMGQEATQSAYMASVSEKLAATMDAIKNTIAQMATGLLPLVERIMAWLSNIENLKKTLSAIAGVMAAIVSYSIAAKIAGSVQAATQLQLLQTMAAQNVVIQRAAIAQAGLTELKVVEAGASVTAGSGYLGPGALAVGIAAITGLMAYLGTRSMMGGGGGGAGGSSGAPIDIGTSAAIAPMNTAAATYTATTAASTPSTAGMSNVSAGGGVGNVYLDGYKVGQLLFNDTHDQVVGKDKS